MKPVFRLEIAGEDRTELVRKRLISLTINDREGFKSDSLDLELDNRDYLLPLPAEDESVRVWLGFEDDGSNDPRFRVAMMGFFTANDPELTGRPHKLKVSCKAADMGVGLKQAKTRGWHEVTFADMLATVAGEHGLKPVVSDELAGVYFPHINQSEESDLHLLTRLARQYDATVKPAGGFLILAVRGDGLSATGAALPVVEIAESDLQPGWSIKHKTRSKYKSVVCEYRTTDSAAVKRVTAGSGAPVLTLQDKAANQSQAQQRAEAAFRKMNRAQLEFSGTLSIGDNRLVSGGRIRLGAGFHPDHVGKELSLKDVTHALRGTYTTRLSAESVNP